MSRSNSEYTEEMLEQHCHLHQLIERCNFSMRDAYISMSETRGDFSPESHAQFRQHCIDQYKIDTGLVLGTAIDEEQALSDIRDFISSHPNLNLSQGKCPQNTWYTPLLHASRTGNLKVVQLMVELGCQNLETIGYNGCENLEQYAYFIKIFPQACTLESQYQKHRRHINFMQKECSHQPERVAAMQACKQYLDQQRDLYLREQFGHQQLDVLATSLPLELMLRLFVHFDAQALCVASLVCKSWHRVATLPELWVHDLLPPYRGDNAKALVLQHPAYRVTQLYLFQLIARLNTPFLAFMRGILRDPGNIILQPVADNAHRPVNQYENETGLSIDDTINPEEVIQEIRQLLRLSHFIDVNKKSEVRNISPLEAAINANSLPVVKLLVEFKASDLEIIPAQCWDNLLMFMYGLSVYPNCYQCSDEYNNLMARFSMMRIECAHQKNRIALLDVTQAILERCRAEYLERQLMDEEAAEHTDNLKM